jgi:hypothetical protein
MDADGNERGTYSSMEMGRSQPTEYVEFTMDELRRLAHEALESHDADTRGIAMAALRPLSHFNQWDHLTEFFNNAGDDVHVIFILAKATSYILKNEVGPGERAGMLSFLMNWCTARLGSVPFFGIQQVFVTAALAVYLNFRTTVLSSVTSVAANSSDDSNEQQQRATMGVEVVNQIRRALGSDLRHMVAFITEVVHRFTEEFEKGGLRTIHDLFVTEVMPHFYAIAVETMGNSVDEDPPFGFVDAMALATSCLEMPPADSHKAIISRFTTEEVVYLHPIEAWLPMLMQALTHVGKFWFRVAEKIDPDTANDRPTQEVLRHSVALSQVAFDQLDNPEPILTGLIEFATHCLMTFAGSPELESIGRIGCSILVNVFERHGAEADFICGRDSTVVGVLCKLLTLTARLWSDYSDDIRILLLNVMGQILTQSITSKALEMNDIGFASSASLDLPSFPTQTEGDYLPLVESKWVNEGMPSQRPRSARGGLSDVPGELGNVIFHMPPAAMKMPGTPRPPKLPGPPLRGKEIVPFRLAGGGGGGGGSHLSYGLENELSNAAGASAKGYDELLATFKEYFDAVLFNCHLTEDSSELHNAEALVLVNEAQLKPVAQILMLCTSDLAPFVVETFHQSVVQHELAVRMRRGEQLAQDQVEQVLNLAMGARLDELNETSFVLIAIRIALSRIGVLMNIVGIMLMHRGTFSFLSDNRIDDFALLAMVAKFARSFTTEDISELLTCMDLSGTRAGLGAGGGGSNDGGTTLHVGVLRSLMYFCNAVVGSGFAEQQVFVNCAVQALTFILSTHSLNAPVLAADCGALITKLAGEEFSSSQFLRSDEFATLIDGHIDNQIALTSSIAGVLASRSKDCMHHRKHVLRSLARAICTRSRVCNYSPLQFYRFLDSLSLMGVDVALAHDVSPADAFLVFLSDVRGIVAGMELQPSLMSLLQWLVNQKESICTRLSDSRCAAALLKTWGKVARVCHNFLSEDYSSPLQLTFCTFAFETIQHVIELRRGRLGADELRSVAQLLVGVLRGTWCNVAIMLYYGDNKIGSILMAALRQFVQSEPAEIMGLKNRDAFFETILACFEVRETTVALRGSQDHAELTFALGHFLVQCLRISASTPLLKAIAVVFAPGSIIFNDASTVAQLMGELAVMLATSAVGAEWTAYVCVVVQRCFNACPLVAEDVLTGLLEQAAAYHRVRLRCLLTLLRNQPDNLAEAFAKTFQAMGPTQQISAW